MRGAQLKRAVDSVTLAMRSSGMLSPRQLALLSASPKAHDAKTVYARIKLTEDERDNLKRLASELGASCYVGIGPGQPAVASIIRAIANGMVGVVDLENGRIHKCSNVIGNMPVRNFKDVLAEYSEGGRKQNQHHEQHQ